MKAPDFLFFLPTPQHPRYPKRGLHLRWRWGWIKGYLFRPYWKLKTLFSGSRVQIGKRFSLQGTLRIRGPGQVILGDDCIVADVCTPFTHSKEALIHIGSRVYLNGTRFGCSSRIEIGDDCILADARILDTDFHSVGRLRNTAAASAPSCGPVRISKNVWVSANSAVLKGVVIGDNSVIGFGSVVINAVPADRIFVGNPAKDAGAVP
jgi:maltose O-acetyltransferase